MKGIVYAIDIKHAEHIAEYYREKGLNAVAISSKTPAEERKNIIERFKGTNDSLKDTNCHELSMSLANNNSLNGTNCHEFKIQNSCFGKCLYGLSATFLLNQKIMVRILVNVGEKT